MKVEFKKDGRWAHENQQLGQFDFHDGLIVDNISENDAKQLEKLGYAVVLTETETETETEKLEIQDEKKLTFPGK